MSGKGLGFFTRGYTIAQNVPTDVVVAFGAEWLQISNCNGALQVSFDGGPYYPIHVNQTLHADFERATFLYTGTAPTSLQFIMLAGQGTAPSLPIRQDQVVTTSPVNDVVCGPGAATQIFGANMRAVNLLACIPTGSANGLRIASSAVSASQGVYLPVGVIQRFAGTTDLWAYNSGAGNITLTASTEKS